MCDICSDTGLVSVWHPVEARGLARIPNASRIRCSASNGFRQSMDFGPRNAAGNWQPRAKVAAACECKLGAAFIASGAAVAILGQAWVVPCKYRHGNIRNGEALPWDIEADVAEYAEPTANPFQEALDAI